MTAVKPSRLNEQIEDIMNHFADPITLRRKCVDILELYADRTRRPNLMETVDEATHSLRVPRPVIRAFGVALRRQAQEHSEHARAASAALWEAEFRETRILACAVLSGQTHDEVSNWALDYIRTSDDRDIAVEMARQGLFDWRKADTSRFLDEVEAWLTDSDRKVRTFALLALGAAVEDLQFKDIPSIFRLIAGFTANAKGEEKRALRLLIQALVERSPPEVVRFLVDEIASGGTPSKNLAYTMLDYFPSMQRNLLERALSSS